jgi:cold shock CspA family protein
MSATDEPTNNTPTEANANATTEPSVPTTRLTGRVKWFNNKTGFGFITALEGDQKDSDIFVHHSTIKVAQDQYRYLVQGEYVEFVLSKITDSASKHEFQAADVSGVKGGKLICETRWESRTAAAASGSGSGSAGGEGGNRTGASRFKREEATPKSSNQSQGWTTVSNERKSFTPSQSSGKEWRRGESSTRGRGRGRGGGSSAE